MTMEQHYPVENNKWRRGKSPLWHISWLRAKARRTGRSQNLNRQGGQLARFIIKPGGQVTAVLQSPFLEATLASINRLRGRAGIAYNRGHSGGIEDTLAVIDEDDAKSDKKRRQNKRDAIARYNRYQDQTSGFQRFAGNTPRLYQCRECDWWFARLNPPRYAEKHSCPRCRSTNLRRVR